ncbi:Ctf19p [Nakaseomyces bracarensis]|uniref:Ctf19p n=1 Tax=Nakaseomyces bracarensis TaxID=273131 RepID=UPI00387198BD
MDFTSDLVETSSSIFASTESGSSDHVEDADVTVSAEEMRRLELEERKKELLEERNTLLREVDGYEREIGELRKRGGVVRVDKNAMDTLVDVLGFSRKQEQAQELERLLDNSQRTRAVLHGGSSVQEELNNKFDSLPLLNMNLRLRYLQEYLYRDVEIRLRNKRKEQGHDPAESVIDAQLSFRRFSTIPFEVHILIRYDEVSQTLKEFTIGEISKEVELQLQPLRTLRNPSFFLMACFEFDKVRARRYKILETLVQKYRKRIFKCEHSRNGENAVFETLDVMKGRKVSLRIDFQIAFEVKKLQYTPYPTSRLSYELNKDDKRVMVSEVETIASGLIREYGLDKGLDELLNVCLFAKLYR